MDSATTVGGGTAAGAAAGTAVAPGIGTIVGAGIGLFSSLLGAGFSAAAAAKAARERLRGSQKALAEFDRVTLPIVQKQTTAFEDVQRDPLADAAQRGALQSYMDRVNGGGFDAQETADVANLQAQSRAEEQSQRNAILQNAMAHGNLNSGATLGAQLASQQAGANRFSHNALDINALKQQRLREALNQQFNMGGQYEQQKFGEQSQLAQARDAIKAFNAAQRQNYFGNQLALAKNRSLAQLNKGEYAGNVQDVNSYNYQNLGKGIGSAAGTVGGWFQNVPPAPSNKMIDPNKEFG